MSLMNVTTSCYDDIAYKRLLKCLCREPSVVLTTALSGWHDHGAVWLTDLCLLALFYR